MVRALAPFGLDGHMPVPSATPESPLEDRLAAVAATETRMGAVLEALAQNLPSPTGVATMTTTITGVDGNDIALYITHPIPADEWTRCRAIIVSGRISLGRTRIRECGGEGTVRVRRCRLRELAHPRYGHLGLRRG